MKNTKAINELSGKAYSNIANSTGSHPWRSGEHGKKSQRVNSMAKNGFEKSFYEKFPPQKTQIVLIGQETKSHYELTFKKIRFLSEYNNYQLDFSIPIDPEKYGSKEALIIIGNPPGILHGRDYLPKEKIKMSEQSKSKLKEMFSFGENENLAGQNYIDESNNIKAKINIPTKKLKENANSKIPQIIQNVSNQINLANKQGNVELANKSRLKLKDYLENLGYNWQQDPEAVDIISESKKNKTISLKNKKIEIMKSKIEQLTNKQITLVEKNTQPKRLIKKSALKESINQPDYQFYIFSLDQKKIIGGNEYAEDAKDYARELGNSLGPVKVYSKKFLISKGFNPDEDSSWGTDKIEQNQQPIQGVNEAKKANILKLKIEQLTGKKVFLKNKPKLTEAHKIEVYKKLLEKYTGKKVVLKEEGFHHDEQSGGNLIGKLSNINKTIQQGLQEMSQQNVKEHPEQDEKYWSEMRKKNSGILQTVYQQLHELSQSITNS